MMTNFDPKAATEQLLAGIASAGSEKDMAISARKASWKAAQLQPINLIAMAARDSEAHAYKEDRPPKRRRVIKKRVFHIIGSPTAPRRRGK